MTSTNATRELSTAEGPRSSPARKRLRNRAKLAAYWALIPIVGFAIWASVARPYSVTPPIRSDGVGYFAWTEAIVEGNFDFCHWPSLIDIGAISAQDPIDPARCQNRYPPGLALLRFPVMGPLAALQSQGNHTDLVIGSAEETASLWLGALGLVITALLMLATLRKLRVRPLIANTVVLAGVFGTGLFNYATYDSSFTHSYSAALLAGIVFIGVSAAERRRAPNPILLFVLALFFGLIRQVDFALLLVLLAAWLVWQVRPLPAEQRLRAAAQVVVPVLAAIAVVAVFELLYNRWSADDWTLSSYGQAQFTVGVFHELPVLSYVFVWYPALAVLLAAAVCARGSWRWGIVAAALVVVLDVIYGAWPDWSLAEDFGQRGFVDLVPVVVVAGGVGISALGRRWRAVALGALVICTLATVELMAGWWDESIGIPVLNTTAHQYWQHVVGSESLLNLHLGRSALL